MEINLDEQKSILYVKPTPPLKEGDFAQLGAVFDGYVAQHGMLKGLIVETAKFPGWKDLNAFKAHFLFIKDHHDKVKKIAVLTDSAMAFIPKLIGNFVSAQIKQFPFGQEQLAEQWILGNE